jgi:hypothetical protein
MTSAPTTDRTRLVGMPSPFETKHSDVPTQTCIVLVVLAC